jgi:hypothetical protein
MKPKLLLITANLLMLLSISPQASYAADDPRVGKLLSQSGTALHVDALRSAEVIHVRPKNVGVDNDLAARGFDRIGAWIIGRNMFGPVRGPWPDDEWKGWWGDNLPFHAPVFVLTNHARSSIPMEGNSRRTCSAFSGSAAYRTALFINSSSTSIDRGQPDLVVSFR